METYLITFSPTGTSRRVARAVAGGLGFVCNDIDVTYKGSGRLVVPSDGVVVAAVPVYGGHPAPVALQRLAELSSEGAAAVAIAVYGNRDYEGALDELCVFLRKAGLRVVAAAAFVGEHSYSTAEFPIAPGRPDSDDLAVAEQFGRDVRIKLMEGGVGAAEVDAACMEHVPVPDDARRRFIEGVTLLHSVPGQNPRVPAVDACLCTGCGQCVSLCPTGAIRSSEPLLTDQDLCIRCCACVKGCGQGARVFRTPYAPLLSANFRVPRQPETLL